MLPMAATGLNQQVIIQSGALRAKHRSRLGRFRKKLRLEQSEDTGKSEGKQGGINPRQEVRFNGPVKNEKGRRPR